LLKVACVLKSDGDYDWEYVNKLYQSINRNLSHEFEFVVFTDIPPKINMLEIIVIPLKLGLPKYWSKIELFRLTGSVLYFDLDTIILGSINSFADEILSCSIKSDSSRHFYMFKAFRTGEIWSSMIMGWDGDFRFLLDEFTDLDMARPGKKWEQRYIKEKLIEHGVDIQSVQAALSGTYSYKHHCRGRIIPLDARVICFHGQPRPRDTELWNYEN
jgi:hypothetical protein